MAMFPLVGVLGDFGWHDAFLIHLIGLPITILAWWTYPHSTPGVSRRISPAPPVHLDLIVLGLCIGIAINPQSIYAPFKLEAIGLHSATKIGFAMMTVPFFASITSPFYVRIRRRASVSVVFTLGFAGLGLGLALFVAGTGLAAALCGYALFGAALGFVAPNMYVVGSRFSGSSHHSAALGQILAGFYSSSLIAQIAIEPWFGTRPIHALAALAGFCILLSVLSLFFRTRSPSPPTAREANVAGQSSPRDA
jgi:MFS family permease